MASLPIRSDTLSADVVAASNNAYVFSQVIVPADQTSTARPEEKQLEEERQQRAEALLSTLGPEKVELLKQLAESASGTDEAEKKLRDALGLGNDDSDTFDKFLQVDSVEYDLSLGKITSSTPVVLASQTLTNDSKEEQEMVFSLSKSETHTSSFDYTLGVTVGAQMKFSGKLYVHA